MSLELEHRVALLNERYGNATAEDLMLAAIRDEFPNHIGIVSSFGADSAVLLHMMASIDVTTPVVFLDTGKLFGETLRYRDQLIARLGLLSVVTVIPKSESLTTVDPKGTLWSSDPDACCTLRKVEPLALALKLFTAWISGRKGYQSLTRARLDAFEVDAGKIKLNPLARWSRNQVNDYFALHDLPRHPLESDGYLSIGCAPCTSRVEAGEDSRAGRWRGLRKTECGIHARGSEQRAL